jgi:hypothetical protein
VAVSRDHASISDHRTGHGALKPASRTLLSSWKITSK